MGLKAAELAQGMFNAYNKCGPNPWKTFDGRDVPRWGEVNDQVRAKWTAAAQLAIDAHTQPPPGVMNPPEPAILINGERLSEAQAMTLRVALSHFLPELSGEFGKNLGELGKSYHDRGREVAALMVRPKG